jgi:hypothetical protein
VVFDHRRITKTITISPNGRVHDDCLSGGLELLEGSAGLPIVDGTLIGFVVLVGGVEIKAKVEFGSGLQFACEKRGVLVGLRGSVCVAALYIPVSALPTLPIRLVTCPAESLIVLFIIREFGQGQVELVLPPRLGIGVMA